MVQQIMSVYDIDGITRDGTSIIIPNSQNYSVEDFTFIKFTDLNSYSNVSSKSNNQKLDTIQKH